MTLGIAAWGGPALAVPTAKLVYVRGEGAERCPDEGELRRAVAQRLGYDPFFPYAEVTLITELEAKRPSGFGGKISVVDAQGHLLGRRLLVSASSECAELVRVLALNLSLTVDDLAPPAPPASSPTVVFPPDEPVAVPPPPPPPEKPPPPPESLSRPSSTRVEIGVGGQGSAGLSPGPAFGISASAGMRTGAFRATGEFFTLLDSSGGDLATVPIGGTMTGGSLAGCGHTKLPFACAKTSIGVLRGGGRGEGAVKEGAAAYVGLGPELGIDLPIGENFVIRLRASVLVALVRPRIFVNDSPAYQMASASASAGADALLRF